jgi:BASS family bile acid:Na+ symporter
MGTMIFVAVVLHNLGGFALGYLVARVFRLDDGKVKAITYEVGMQNSGLAAALALRYFSGAAAIPGAIFSVWHNVAASALVSLWSRRGAGR